MNYDELGELNLKKFEEDLNLQSILDDIQYLKGEQTAINNLIASGNLTEDIASYRKGQMYAVADLRRYIMEGYPEPNSKRVVTIWEKFSNEEARLRAYKLVYPDRASECDRLLDQLEEYKRQIYIALGEIELVNKSITTTNSDNLNYQQIEEIKKLIETLKSKVNSLTGEERKKALDEIKENEDKLRRAGVDSNNNEETKIPTEEEIKAAKRRIEKLKSIINDPAASEYEKLVARALLKKQEDILRRAGLLNESEMTNQTTIIDEGRLLPPGNDPSLLPPGNDPSLLPPGNDPSLLPPGRDDPPTRSNPKPKRTYDAIFRDLMSDEGDFKVAPEEWFKEGFHDKTNRMANRLRATEIKFNKRYFKNIFSAYGNWKSNWKYNLAHLTTGHFAIFQPVVNLFKKATSRLFLFGKQRRRTEILRRRADELSDEDAKELYDNYPFWTTDKTKPRVLINFLKDRCVRYENEVVIPQYQQIVDSCMVKLVDKKKQLDALDKNAPDYEQRKAEILKNSKELISSVRENMLAGMKIKSQGISRDCDAYNTFMSRMGRRDSRGAMADYEKYDRLNGIIRGEGFNDEEVFNSFFGMIEETRRDYKTSNVRGTYSETGSTFRAHDMFNIMNRQLDYREDFLRQAAVRAIALAVTAANIANAIHVRNVNARNVNDVNAQNAGVNAQNAQFEQDAQNTLSAANNDLNAAGAHIDTQNEMIGDLAGEAAMGVKETQGLSGILQAHRHNGVLSDADAHIAATQGVDNVRQSLDNVTRLFNNKTINSYQYARRTLAILNAERTTAVNSIRSTLAQFTQYTQRVPGFDYTAELDLPNVLASFGTQNIAAINITGNYVLPGHTALAAYVNGLEDTVRVTTICSLAQYAMLTQSANNLKQNLDIAGRSIADAAIDNYYNPNQEKNNEQEISNPENTQQREPQRKKDRHEKVGILKGLRNMIADQLEQEEEEHAMEQNGGISR